jgi:hypothetical protein
MTSTNTSTTTGPSTCEQAIQANLNIIEINKNIKQDYDNRSSSAYNTWQNAVTSFPSKMSAKQMEYKDGYYVLPRNQYFRYDANGNKTVYVISDGELDSAGIFPDFWNARVAHKGILYSCPQGFSGCCALAGANEVDSKCCAMGKYRSCTPCSGSGCGVWTTSQTPEALAQDDRLNVNLFQPFIDAYQNQLNAEISNLQNIYNSIKPPTFQPTFNITCCQTILGSNINANASTITFNGTSNTCTVNNQTQASTTMPTTTSRPTDAPTTIPTQSATIIPIEIFNSDPLGILNKINALPQQQQIGVWVGVAFLALFIVLILAIIIKAIVVRNREY